MKKLEILCFVLAAIVLTAILAEFSVQINALEDQNASLQTELDLKSQQILTLQAEKLGLQGNITSLQGQIGALQDQTILLQTEKLGLETQITGLEAQVADLQLQIQHDTQNEILGVYFSPGGGCEDQVLYWIDRANSSIEILIYSFTLDLIGDALVEAHERGVEVQVVFEVEQISQYSEYMKLKAAGIKVRNDTNSGDMHDKIMIIDGIIIITGSFNYSNAVENTNNENLLIINSTTVATTYGQEFAKIWDESLAAEEEEETPPTPPPQQLDIEISYINYDAPGDDWDNLNGEYVTIQNSGSENADLTGWRLVDAASHTFTFPSFTLAPGSTVTVYTGSGTNTQTSLYWGSSSPIWNNDHDTAYLYDSSGELIDSYSW